MTYGNHKFRPEEKEEDEDMNGGGGDDGGEYVRRGDKRGDQYQGDCSEVSKRGSDSGCDDDDVVLKENQIEGTNEERRE